VDQITSVRKVTHFLPAVTSQPSEINSTSSRWRQFFLRNVRTDLLSYTGL